jgi:hypothetical protein
MKISIHNYINYSKIEEPTDEQVLVSLFGLSSKQLNNLSVDEFKTHSTFAENFLKINHSFSPYFKHKGVWYGFIPNLNDITYGENKDLVRYITDTSKAHRAIAVAYRPIKKNWLGKPVIKKGKYLIEDYNGTSNADVFLDLDAGVLLGMYVFFYNLTNELVRYTPNYLQYLGVLKELETTSRVSGETIKRYIHLHKEILQDLKI